MQLLVFKYLGPVNSQKLKLYLIINMSQVAESNAQDPQLKKEKDPEGLDQDYSSDEESDNDEEKGECGY